MTGSSNPNLEILLLAVKQLGPIVADMVFLGGCATPLLVTDPASAQARFTRDVDVITELTSRNDYYRLCAKLRERGFLEDTSEDAPLCRWISGGILLDVMPTDAGILGFSNRWYGPAIEKSAERTLPSGHTIRLVTAPYFLATKLEAFYGRGGGDYMASHDMEDIVSLIDGRRELIGEILQDDNELRDYLKENFSVLLNIPDFLHALPGHLPPDAAGQARLPLLIERIRNIAGLE
ncbi:MAG: hypothetical protein OEV42_18705 [Deltaproteobacteria bacterium]|nr:hypothetical protein [Deltaproteobacteria bacterium]